MLDCDERPSAAGPLRSSRSRMELRKPLPTFSNFESREHFYVVAEARFDLPAGTYTVPAARGPMAPVAETEVRVRANDTATAELTLTPIWDVRAAGYISADHHVHLNGDGHHRADHDDAPYA